MHSPLPTTTTIVYGGEATEATDNNRSRSSSLDNTAINEKSDDDVSCTAQGEGEETTHEIHQRNSVDDDDHDDDHDDDDDDDDGAADSATPTSTVSTATTLATDSHLTTPVRGRASQDLSGFMQDTSFDVSDLERAPVQSPAHQPMNSLGPGPSVATTSTATAAMAALKARLSTHSADESGIINNNSSSSKTAERSRLPIPFRFLQRGRSATVHGDPSVQGVGHQQIGHQLSPAPQTTDTPAQGPSGSLADLSLGASVPVTAATAASASSMVSAPLVVASTALFSAPNHGPANHGLVDDAEHLSVVDGNTTAEVYELNMSPDQWSTSGHGGDRDDGVANTQAIDGWTSTPTSTSYACTSDDGKKHSIVFTELDVVIKTQDAHTCTLQSIALGDIVMFEGHLESRRTLSGLFKRALKDWYQVTAFAVEALLLFVVCVLLLLGAGYQSDPMVIAAASLAIVVFVLGIVMVMAAFTDYVCSGRHLTTTMIWSLVLTTFQAVVLLCTFVTAAMVLPYTNVISPAATDSTVFLANLRCSGPFNNNNNIAGASGGGLPIVVGEHWQLFCANSGFRSSLAAFGIFALIAWLCAVICAIILFVLFTCTCSRSSAPASSNKSGPSPSSDDADCGADHRVVLRFTTNAPAWPAESRWRPHRTSVHAHATFIPPKGQSAHAFISDMHTALINAKTRHAHHLPSH